MATKILILMSILFASVNGFSLVKDYELKNSVFFKPSFLIDVLADAIGPLQLSSYLIRSSNESDYLNELAKTLAENVDQCPIGLISKYAKSEQVKNILTFGFKLRGNITLEEMLLRDPTQVLDHMSGFIDFRYKNTKISLLAKEIRELVQSKSSGFVSFSSENFKQAINFNNSFNTWYIMRLYQEFLRIQVKSMDKNGTILLGFNPLTFRIELKNFRLKLTTEIESMMNINTTIPYEQLLDEIDEQYRSLYEGVFQEGFQLLNVINKYGFGISLNRSNDEITVVYSFGFQVDEKPVKSKKKMGLKFSDFVFLPSEGEKLSIKPFDYERDSILAMRKLNNKLVMHTVNFNRLNNGLKAIKQGDFKLYHFAQNEANRMVSLNKLIEPQFKSIEKNTLLMAFRIVGGTAIKELFFGFIEDNNGTVGCFDNFTNQTFVIYNIADLNETVCNSNVISEWRKLENFGTGISYNTDGDLFITLAVSN